MMGEDNNDNGEVVPDDRWTAFFVTSAFWIACLAWLIANSVPAARPSLLILHVVAGLSFLLQGTCGAAWAGAIRCAQCTSIATLMLPRHRRTPATNVLRKRHSTAVLRLLRPQDVRKRIDSDRVYGSTIYNILRK